MESMKEKNVCSSTLIPFKCLADGKLTVNRKKGNDKRTWLNTRNKDIVLR